VPGFVNYKKDALDTPDSSTIKTGCHDIAEILLKVAFKTKNQSISKQLDRTHVSQLRNVFSILFSTCWSIFSYLIHVICKRVLFDIFTFLMFIKSN
jgi:hypothetical protein